MAFFSVLLLLSSLFFISKVSTVPQASFGQDEASLLSNGKTPFSLSSNTLEPRGPEEHYAPECDGEFDTAPGSANFAYQFANGLYIGSYKTVQQLCAAEQYGGKVNTTVNPTQSNNMGFVCIEISVPSQESSYSTVWGQLVQILEYADSSIREIPGIQRTCNARCKCQTRSKSEESDNSGVKVSDDPYNLGIKGYKYQPKPTTESDQSFHPSDSVSSFEPLPRQSRPRPRRGGKKRCFDNTPESCMVILPQLVTTTIASTLPATYSEEEFCHAGTRCKRDLSCDWAGTGTCSCTARSFDVALGLFGALGCGIWQKQHHRLGNRDVKEEEIVACPCNATYVSNACCDSQSKLVWEAPHLRLGGLAPGLLDDL